MEQPTQKRRIVVGISGASGMQVAWKLLETLYKLPYIETHLVMTESARITIPIETDKVAGDFQSLADVNYDSYQMSAAIASGSFYTEGMVIVPCSMKSAAGIACGFSDNLLLRAADCMIKERRRLVLMVRECPFSQIHLRNMEFLASCGVDILPMMMTFYNHPKSVDDMVTHVVARVLERFQIDTCGYHRWNGVNE